MRRIKDLEINTSKSEKPFIPNWKAVGTILGINGEMLRQRITSTICATKDKKGFITNYTSSNDGFSFDITDELVNSNYTKRTDNQKKISGIYKITNTITGDFYIGSSKDVKRRWREHKIHSTWNKCPNNPMYIDMRKYGLENFEFQVIEEIEIEKLKETEQKFIETLKPTYNSNRANGWNVERYKENQKEYYKSDKGKKYQKEFYKEYNNQLCSYNGEILTLQALSKRFQRAGIPHPQLEAKKYLIL